MASVTVPRVSLGSQGLVVSKQGLGAMGMSFVYGPPKPEEEMIDLIHHAVESGITFIDTADMYGPYTNEILVGKGIKGIREKVQLATKFGNVIEDGKWSVRGDPQHVHNSVEWSLKRLNVQYIDLYYLHRVDENVPIEITVGEMKKFVNAGIIKYIGLSEASAADIRRAHAIHPITAVQVEYSLWSRDVEEDVIPTCRELGIGIVPYSPLGRGFFSGVMEAEKMDSNDFRRTLPRFQAENLVKNKEFYDRLVAIASKKNATAGQLALAWVHHQGKDVVPIPGTTKVKNFEENKGALALKLTDEEAKEIEDAVPHTEVQGDRYDDMWHTWRYRNSLPLEKWTGVRDNSNEDKHNLPVRVGNGKFQALGTDESPFKL